MSLSNKRNILIKSPRFISRGFSSSKDVGEFECVEKRVYFMSNCAERSRIARNTINEAFSLNRIKAGGLPRPFLDGCEIAFVNGSLYISGQIDCVGHNEVVIR